MSSAVILTWVPGRKTCHNDHEMEGSADIAGSGLPIPSPARLPRWRGFNLLNKFTTSRGNRPFLEADFALVRELGFNFVRLPMDYRCWISGGDWLKFDENALKEIDAAVGYGRSHGIHVCLNLHRAPGYCVNPPKEERDLWTDPAAQEAAAAHWAAFARRYRGIPNENLSFDLFNEPANVTNEEYAKVVRIMAASIRKEDADRLIIADGTQWGNRPVPEISDLGVAQSTRGYAPMQISHFRAGWVDKNSEMPEPSWPMTSGPGGPCDRNRLWKEQIEPWKKLEAMGVGIHVGEWGAFNKTPHHLVLAWARDCLENWKKAGWGWAMWEFSGAFGIFDSGRTDVQYEDFRGRKLDRKLLELLGEH
jgi:endoglucanase